MPKKKSKSSKKSGGSTKKKRKASAEESKNSLSGKSRGSKGSKGKSGKKGKKKYRRKDAEGEGEEGGEAGENEPTDSGTDSGSTTGPPKDHESGGGGGGGEHYFGMYRKIGSSGVGKLTPVHKAFAKFHPWRPKGEWFITSGYYFDMDGGGDDLKPSQLKIHNLPSGTKEFEIKREIQPASKIKINDDGTAFADFSDASSADKAYNDTKLVKMGNRHLAFMTSDEVYLVGVPDNISAEDLENDYPGNKGVRFIEEPGAKRTAVIKFPNSKAADEAFDSSPYRKIGKRQNGFEAEENPLHLTNLPPNLTEDDLQKSFPAAKEITIDHKTGIAKVRFDSEEDAHKAYDDSDLVKLGRPKIAWLKSEELALEGVPKKMTPDELKKVFPTARNIKITNAEGGKRIAFVEFASDSDQKKAYDSSQLKKIGPQRLGWDGGKGAKLDKNAILKVEGLAKGTTEEDLMKMFPGALNVALKIGGRAEIQFASAAEAEKAWNDSGMAKLGDKSLGFVGPTQLAVQDVPGKNDNAIKSDMPNAQKIKWIKGPGKTKVAVVDFADAAERRTGYDNSNFNKTGPQSLRFEGDEIGDIEGMDDMDLAKKLWKIKGTDFSNMSNNFSASIMLIGVPQDTKDVDLIKMFEDCKKCDFSGSGSKRIATLEFDKPTSAAKAYSKATKTKIGGKEVKVKVVPLHSSKKGSKGSLKKKK